MRLVINSSNGGFQLSKQAEDLYKKYIHEKDPDIIFSNDFFTEDDIGRKIPRYDPCLIRVVEELRHSKNSEDSDLKIVRIPDGIKWMIQEYDGYEWVSQAHTIYSEYPMDNDWIISGKGTESQSLYHPPSMHEKERNMGEELDKALNTCKTQ